MTTVRVQRHSSYVSKHFTPFPRLNTNYHVDQILSFFFHFSSLNPSLTAFIPFDMAKSSHCYSHVPKMLSKHTYASLRRSRLSFIILTLIISVSSITCLIVKIVSGTRSNSPEMSEFVRKLLPAGTCLCESSTTFDCAYSLEALSTLPSVGDADKSPTLDPDWRFDFDRDGQNLGLTLTQCETAFPGLFEDVIRAVDVRWENPISDEELDDIELGHGMVRATIFEGKVYSFSQARHRVS